MKAKVKLVQSKAKILDEILDLLRLSRYRTDQSCYQRFISTENNLLMYFWLPRQFKTVTEL